MQESILTGFTNLPKLLFWWGLSLKGWGVCDKWTESPNCIDGPHSVVDSVFCRMKESPKWIDGPHSVADESMWVGSDLGVLLTLDDGTEKYKNILIHT